MTTQTPAQTALALAPTAALAMVMDPSEAEARLHELQEFVRRNMVADLDYGTIPGTPKPTLYQPGAQKLAEIYGFAVSFEDSRAPIERWGDDGSEPLFAYFKRARITRRSDGMVIGEGIGSCNTREKKYAGRWVFERDVPAGLDTTRLPKKEGMGKNNRPYVQYKVPNPEIFDVINTVEKMACKRALVMGVIAATRSAGIFTQDVEDMSPEARGAAAAGKSTDVPDAEIVEPSPAVSAEVLAQRARWKTDGGDGETERVLLGSPDPNDRAIVFEWRIGEATTGAALAAIVAEVTRDPHLGMRADMLLRAEEARRALGSAAA